METIAVPCDGKVECQDDADESWLCTEQNIIVYAIFGRLFCLFLKLSLILRLSSHATSPN